LVAQKRRVGPGKDSRKKLGKEKGVLPGARRKRSKGRTGLRNTDREKRLGALGESDQSVWSGRGKGRGQGAGRRKGAAVKYAGKKWRMQCHTFKRRKERVAGQNS